MGKLIKRILILFGLVALVFAVSYAWRAFPILTGYGAKNICSCTFVAGRDPESVIRYELGQFPLSLGSFSVNYQDSSASGSVFGFAPQKAIFRKGLGCSLVVGLAEEQIRAQPVKLAQPIHVNDSLFKVVSTQEIDTAQTFDRNRLNEVLEEAFSEPGPDSLRRTRAVVIVHDGKIIAERYAKGFNEHSKLIGWSMTKSITNALVGILVKEGKLDIEAPAPIEEWQHDERKNITLHHLLQASSGLDWEEEYAGPSGATNMLFKSVDMGVYAADVPLAHRPGELFYYSSGTTNIISRIIRKTVGDTAYHKFPYEKLLYKIGMTETVIEPDAGGTFVGSSYSFGTARDWARFGLLYLNDGVWNRERILPEGWVRYTTTPAPGADKGQYGAQFWLNAGAPDNSLNRTFPDVPTDTFWADGFEGQSVFIIPSERLVVVKLSLSQGDYLDDNLFLKEILAAKR